MCTKFCVLKIVFLASSDNEVKVSLFILGVLINCKDGRGFLRIVSPAMFRPNSKPTPRSNGLLGYTEKNYARWI